MTDSRGRTATYERKRGSNGVRRLVPIDIDDSSVALTTSRKRSETRDSNGGDCWFGIFCGQPPMCTGPTDDCAVEISACEMICRRAATDPNMPNIWSGAIGRCMRGCVSERCGGNKV